MIVFNKLWKLLETRGMKRTDLLCILSSATIAKLGKNDIVKTDTIDKICDYLGCTPMDIMEYIPKSAIDAVSGIFAQILEQGGEEGRKMLLTLRETASETDKDTIDRLLANSSKENIEGVIKSKPVE